ncbi:helix-turn-helix transcriptional regulator [Natrialbaceae archaeon A-CW3]
MDAREHRALLMALVVLGCLCTGFPSVAAADSGVTEAGVGAHPSFTGVDGATVESDSESDPIVGDSDATLLAASSFALNETDDGTETATDGEGDDETADNGTATDDETTTDNDTPSFGATPAGYDELAINVQIYENGTATWTLEYRYRLDGDENASDRWESVRAEIEDDPERHLELVEENWSERVEEAANVTGREMSASGYQVTLEETSSPQETGYVRFQFHWEEFARVELNRIEVGDAFGHIELDDRTQLVVTWPAEYEDTMIEPIPDDRRDRAAIWNGDQTDFLEGEPIIELMEQTAGQSEEEPSTEPLIPLSWLGFGSLFVLAAVALLGWFILRDGDIEKLPPHTWSESSAESGEPTAPQPVTPPDDLLSNEERVLKLLERHGGRMKQQKVAAELEWTEAKTSQVVGGLRESGDIDAFRIGRENVLTLSESVEPAVGNGEPSEDDDQP